MFIELVMLSNHLIPFPFCLQSFPASKSFPIALCRCVLILELSKLPTNTYKPHSPKTAFSIKRMIHWCLSISLVAAAVQMSSNVATPLAMARLAKPITFVRRFLFGIWSHHFMANRWGSSVRLYFWGAPKSLQMVTLAMKLKDACSLKRKL